MTKSDDLVRDARKHAQHHADGTPWDEADRLLAEMADRIEALEAENAALKEYAFEVSKALTSLTVGGSEFFTTDKRFGFYEADIPACLENIKWRMDQRYKLGKAKARAALQEGEG